MKDKNDKHKFKESKIGKIIYGFLLFMPLFAIGVTCGYAMFNKNAYQSFDRKEVVSNLQLSGNYVANNNAIIQFTPSNNLGSQYNNYQTFQITGDKIQVLDEQIYTVLNMPREFVLQNLQIGMGENGKQINLRYNDAWHNTQNVWGNTIKQLELVFVNGQTINIPNTQNNTNVWAFITQYKQTTTLDNVFYDSVNKVTQSNLFNWVTTSNIYTGMSNFTTAMSVTNTFIPMLLTYWLIISVIYFLYDMVLILLTVLHRKIHNLQDSI